MTAHAEFVRRRPLRLAAWLLLAGTLLHLALAAGTGLSPDEAHYALFGAHPDWSYFDHPGLTGWLQAPFAEAGGSDMQMRIVPMSSWLLAAVLTVALCRRLATSDDDVRRDAPTVAALLLLSPLLNLLGVALVPDTLLMPLVPAAMLATWNLREAEALGDWRKWAALGAVLGLCLLAKYTGLFVVAGAVATLASFHGRSLTRRPGAWLAAALVALMAAPILGWNARHDWMSLAYQGGHALGDQPWRPLPMLRAIALQALLFGPLIPFCAMRLLRRHQDAAVESAVRRDARGMGLRFGVPVLVVFLCLAGRGSSLPHWTACGWMALLPLAVAGARDLRRCTLAGLGLWQAALLAAIVAVVATDGPFSETGPAAVSAAGVHPPGARLNPVADLHGWSAAADHARELAAQQHARGLVVMNWSLASRLAWYGRPLPVFVAPPRRDQFQLWFGALQPGDAAIAVDWSGMPLPPPVGPAQFARCTPLDQLATIEGNRQLAHFNFLLCQDWHGSVASPPRSNSILATLD